MSCTLSLVCTHTHTRTHRALENQINDLVTKITEGQGLPWPKPAHLKRLASYEKTRVMLLRQLEIKLRVRQPDEFVMATEPQIAHVVRKVYPNALQVFWFMGVYSMRVLGQRVYFWV